MLVGTFPYWYVHVNFSHVPVCNFVLNMLPIPLSVCVYHMLYNYGIMFMRVMSYDPMQALETKPLVAANDKHSPPQQPIGVTPVAALGGTSIVMKWDFWQEGGTGSHFLVSGV